MKNRCLFSELKEQGFTEEQILRLFKLMENLPVHNLANDKNLSVTVTKGHIII